MQNNWVYHAGWGLYNKSSLYETISKHTFNWATKLVSILIEYANIQLSQIQCSPLFGERFMDQWGTLPHVSGDYGR